MSAKIGDVHCNQINMIGIQTGTSCDLGNLPIMRIKLLLTIEIFTDFFTFLGYHEYIYIAYMIPCTNIDYF